MDVAGWLRKLGLEQYEPAFRENKIDSEILPKLTAEDLKDLGVSSVGDRRRLLDAIASLRGEAMLPAEGIDPVGAAARGESGRSGAERRQLSVLFCDLVGSTALAARLDPEDMSEIIGTYHRCCTEQIGKAGGFVAKYMGDGVLAYFGYPQAHEDDAERALRAGLTLVESVPKLRAGRDAALQVRVGIATGLVVVGDLIGEGDAQERGVVGETPNLAARLQELAERGQVIISQSTRRLAGGLFEYRDLGAVALKGLAYPVQAWHVVGTSTVQSRFEAQHEARLTPLVGREEELELLMRRWRQAAAGEGRVVLVSGEPGIGKSRLIAELQERLQAESHTRLRYFCSPHHTDSAFHPVIAQLERAAGLARQDPPHIRLEKLASLLDPGSDRDLSVQLLAELLSIPSADRYPPLNMTPQRQKEKTLEALMRQLEALARSVPVFMVYEDAHWIDPSSRELLDVTIERVAAMSVLLIVTFRPEFQPPWVGQAHVTTVTLNRLSRREGATLVGQVVGNQAIGDDLVAEIVERTDGVPLFVEEMTKAVLEAGGREDRARVVSGAPLPLPAVPPTLHASLMARLDRLGTAAKEIAQIGAVIGREFSYELLASVANRSDAEVQAALDRLSEAGLVFRRGLPAKANLLFKHALVRDAAYSSLLRGQRQQLHARIAASLENQFPEVATMQPEVVAQHCVEAGSIEKATSYWLRAGQRAAQRSATTESVAHFTKGIDALARLPAAPQRDRQELRFRLALGPALIATRGWNSAEAEASYRRALTLCEELGEQRDRFDALWGLWLTVGTSDLRPAQTLVTELSLIADRLGDNAFRLQAHHAGWATFSFLGELERARDHMREGLRIYDPEKHKDHALNYGGHDPGVCAKGQDSVALWLLGYPDQAARSADEAMALAQSLKHIPSLAHALLWKCAICDVARRDQESARQCSNRLLALATEQGLALYLAVGTIVRGWTLVHQGSIADGLAALRHGYGRYCDINKLFRPYFGAVCADALLFANEMDHGMNVLTEAVHLAGETHELFWLAEMLNLRGKFFLLTHRKIEAEESYRRAYDIAQGQNARSLQLRAATSLARFWRDEDRRAEARDLLAPIYGWFTEGFDTPDLMEAKEILDTL
jgi:class 3 adenylate cyclase/tetratricopeptide (TPR) repeat protein